jgi:hypothetical protein
MAAPTNSAIITGRTGSLTFGVGNTVIEVKDWKVTRKNKVAAVATSQTAGYQATALGIYSWSLSFTAILPTGNLDVVAGLAEGTLVAFTGKTATSGTGCSFAGSARIESIDEAVAIDGGELSANISATGDGAYVIS